MKIKIILILIILIITLNIKTSSAFVRINEIMYNPAGEDNNNEYVEIYFDENINFSYYFIGDFVNNDSLKLIKNNNIKNNNKNNFILIVEEDFNYDNISCCAYSAGKNIGNGLGNKGDTIFLFDKNNKIIDKITYTNNYANGNGKSLGLVNGFWSEQDPSPCEENFVGVNNFNKDNLDLNNKNDNINNTDISIGVNIEVKDNRTKELITSDIVFESKKVRMTRLIPYIIITILLIISIVLIWRR